MWPQNVESCHSRGPLGGRESAQGGHPRQHRSFDPKRKVGKMKMRRLGKAGARGSLHCHAQDGFITDRGPMEPCGLNMAGRSKRGSGQDCEKSLFRRLFSVFRTIVLPVTAQKSPCFRASQLWQPVASRPCRKRVAPGFCPNRGASPGSPPNRALSEPIVAPKHLALARSMRVSLRMRSSQGQPSWAHRTQGRASPAFPSAKARSSARACEQ